MKTYRVALLDFSKGNGRIVWMKYAKGLKEARALSPIKCSYCRNAKCFTGWKGAENVVITEV